MQCGPATHETEMSPAPSTLAGALHFISASEPVSTIALPLLSTATQKRGGTHETEVRPALASGVAAVPHCISCEAFSAPETASPLLSTATQKLGRDA